MIAFRKILVPVDFSEHSKLAAEKALSLAQICQAGLYFLHVGETAQRSARQLCRFLNKLHPPADLRMKKLVAQGTPDAMILASARKLGADAIIMGHRDLSGLKHLVQGSVAEKVLRSAACPVLLIKKPKAQDVNDYVMPQVRQIKDPFIADNILVPLDFSPASKQAFQYAAYLASHYNSTIYTLTVFDKKSKERGDDAKLHTAVTVRGKKVHLWQAFPRLFNTSALNPARIRVKRLLLAGDPSARIESVVQKKEIDLVIMGTNGKTGLEHFLVGSVAEKVLKSVDCPVMTIRAHNSSAA